MFHRGIEKAKNTIITHNMNEEEINIYMSENLDLLFFRSIK